LAIGYLAR